MMKSQLILVVLLCLLTSRSLGYRDEGIHDLLIGLRDRMGLALNKNDTEELIGIKEELKRIRPKAGSGWIVNYYLGEVNWYLAIFYQQSDDKEAIKKSVDEGSGYIKESIRLNDGFAESYILLAALDLFNLYLEPTSSVSISQNIDRNLRKAQMLDYENPRIPLLSGIYNYYTPEVYGGGFLKAKDKFLESIGSFSTYKPDSSYYPVWGQEEPYVWLGQIAERQDSLNLAKSYYENVLEINPNYSRVRNDLLPNLLKEDDFSGLYVWLIVLIVFSGVIAIFVFVFRNKVSN